MKNPNQKLKLLLLMKIMLEQTDEEHPLTVKELIEKLSQNGVSAERKSIYDDMEYLRLFGIDICTVRSRSTGYYVGEREFELPELKLLVDSVQSSKFITRKKSLELISKIEKLTSREYARKLHRQVYVTNRAKTLNEQIYYNVDKIHDAIAANKQITFRYFDIDVNKEKVYRKSGGIYTESPVSLSWDDENYYMITYKSKYSAYTHYRVDRMESINITDNSRDLSDEQFDLSAYAKKMFQMFGGEETEVTVEFENSLVGAVYDRFGIDIPIIPKDDTHFICHIKVAVSHQFLGWIMSFGSRAKIIAPQSVIDELRALVGAINQRYEDTI